MRIALFTIFRIPNFGSVLQAYATQHVLEQQGHECVVIDYRKDQSTWRKLRAAFSPYKIACRLGIKPQFRKPRRLNKFIKNNFHLSKRYEGIESLRQEDWHSYDAVVVGSDQVWNARYHGKDNVYLLPFIDEGVDCYSLASSFASKEIPKDCSAEYQKKLSKFKAISVREANGVQLVESLMIGKRAQLVLDPTLWISGEQWISNFKPTKNVSKGPYILLYMWTYAFEPRPYIYEVVKYWKTKLIVSEVIALEGSPKAWECDTKIIDKADSSIPQFIDLFANASLVITSSFHGTAFAINFGRPLISIVPNGKGDDRQSSLLRSVGAESSIVHINDSISKINPYYDVELISERLSHLRQESLCWIKNQIR